MRGFLVSILLLVCCIFFSGCATTYGSWSSATMQNTRYGYEKFIEAYPNSEFAEEARKRIDDPDYAFLTTCRIGTEKALEGYLSSYPSSDYTSMVSAYADFLKETKQNDLKSYEQFIAQHSNSPFVTEAKIATPLLWLEEKGQNVGVVVNIGKVIFKGILGGGKGNVEKIREKVYQRFKAELENENVRSVLLDNLEPSKTKEEGIQVAVIVDYSESEYPKSSPPVSGGLYKSPVVDAVAWSAADSLSSIIYKPAHEIITISIKGINNGVEYYSGFSGLSSSMGKMINRNEVLKAIGESPGPANEMVALKGKDLSDPEVSKRTKELLKQLKSSDVQKNVH